MAGRDGGRSGPPYVTDALWEGFLNKVRLDLGRPPARFDRGVWSALHYSGSNQSALKSALRFLGLVSLPEWKPTPQFQQVLTATDSERKRQVWGPIIETTYRKAVFDGLDLALATRDQLLQACQRAGSGPQTADKALAFFVFRAKDAGLTLYPQVTLRAPSPRGFAKNGSNRNGQSRLEKRPLRSNDGPGYEKEARRRMDPAILALMDRLAIEGPAWTAEQRQRWLRALVALVDLAYPAPDGSHATPAEVAEGSGIG